MPATNVISSIYRNQLLQTLQARFAQYPHRRKGINWDEVQAKMEANPGKLWSLHQMEESGGEPDVVGYDKQTGEYIFYDCAGESPKGRRSVCYDGEALASRKENKPKNSAMEMAAMMGIALLTEAEYRALQQLGPVDTKTSSWIKTPPGIRKLGGAIFGDYRYGQAFIYHNGAESYYAARGFRGVLKV
jgi:hypothetical protein